MSKLWYASMSGYSRSSRFVDVRRNVIAAARLQSYTDAEIALIKDAFDQVDIKDTQGLAEMWDGTIASGFAGGTGTASNPFLISNGRELAHFSRWAGSLRSNQTVHVALVSNINLGYRPWTPISSAHLFGSLDGRGYAISRLFINTTASYQGLFGNAPNIAIRNIRLVDSYIRGGNFVGGIIGRGGNTTIFRVDSRANVSGIWAVGGIAGIHSGGVGRSRNFGNVRGSGFVGGLVGHFTPSSSAYDISQSANSGTVVGYYDVGGLVGSTVDHAVIRASYNTGNFGALVGGNNHGGLIGRIENELPRPTSGANIVNSYNAGMLLATGASPPDVVGGLIGYAGSYDGFITEILFLSNAFYLRGSLGIFPDISFQARSCSHLQKEPTSAILVT